MTHTPRKAGVFGWPVAHSLSPALHGYWLGHYGIEGSYELLPVKPENLEAAIRGLQGQGFVGANVTVPHKDAAAKIMDRLDDVAAALGAVNLIIVGEDGALEGCNTDGFGFVENLKAAAPHVQLQDTKAVLLGAGGTTKAVAYALQRDGAKLTIANRTEDKAHALAAQLGGIEVVPWTERSAALEGAHLLVNTTTLGMTGQAPLSIDLEGLAAGAAVADCVYAPLETDLLKAAKAKGFVAVDGLGMLIHQARPAFKAWFGVDPEVTPALRAHLIKAQQEIAS
jgi:shikimate dehydrogenase